MASVVGAVASIPFSVLNSIASVALNTYAAVVGIFLGASVMDLFNTFVDITQRLGLVLKAFLQFLHDRTKSYAQLAKEGKERMEEVDGNFKDAIDLSQQIGRMCLHPNNTEDRTLCIEKQVDVYKTISDLRTQRREAREKYQYYKGWAEWWDGDSWSLWRNVKEDL